MKIRPEVWANASALAVGVIYVACAAWVAFFPAMARVVAISWFHGMGLEEIWTGAPRGNFILGLVTAMGGTWLVGYLFAWFYNKLGK